MTRRLALTFVLSFILACPLSTQQQAKHTFPTKDQITLLVSQAERAFDLYERALQLESQLSANTTPIGLATDRKVLSDARQVMGALKQDPDYFNAPMGFLLVVDLDDGSRNMALCGAQAGMEAATDMQKGKSTAAFAKLHVAQSCTDTSQLLQTVGESAFSLYDNYLLANHDALQSCLGIVKGQKGRSPE